MRPGSLSAIVCLASLFLACRSAGAQSPDEEALNELKAGDNARVRESIRSGAAWLGENLRPEMDSGVRALGALAMLKAEVPVGHPQLASAIQAVVGRVENGEYTAGPHHVYQAGVEASLLVDADTENPQRYRPQLEAIVNYIIGQQLPNGGWDYPTGREGHGDTSVVQYACLGLWAGERAGIEIPQSTWDQAMTWHITTQNSDGGCSYVPGTTRGHEQGASSINMTMAGLCSTLIAARFSYPGRADSYAQLLDLRSQPRRSGGAANRFGPLEAVDLSQVRQPETDEAAPAGATETTVDIERLKQFVQRAFGYTAREIGPRKSDTYYAVYYYYTMERMCALANVEQVGNFPWFQACADDLIARQSAEGHWQISRDPIRDTAFIVLFLTRSTARILGHQQPFKPIGGGLQTGGRLPPGTDLSDIRIDANGILVQAKDLGPLDDMLASLSNLGDAGIGEVQRQIVEKVQIGDREALIENKQRLLELVDYQNPDEPEHAAQVRQTAVWALGRTNDLSLARILIRSLDDVNYDVMLEARNALCWLARRPNGLGEANDPLESVPENASPDQRRAATAAWHAEAFRNWGEWYLQIRPYEDRGDEFEAWLLDRMGQL